MEKQKKFFTNFVVILLAVLGTTVPLALSSPKAALAADATPKVRDVVINEVMWTGTSASPKDQWIELKNTTNQAIDISGWQLPVADGGAPLVIPDGKTIDANGYFLISAHGISDPNTVLNVTPDLVDPALSLGSNCFTLALWSSFPSSVIDSMGCNAAKYFYPGDSTRLHSLERNFVITDGLLATSWHEAAKSTNILNIATDVLATPGSVNSDFVAPVTNLTVTDVPNDNGSAVTLNWTASPDAVSYNISYQKEDGSGTITNTTSTTTSYSVSGLDPQTKYTFSVVAVDSNNNFSVAVPIIGQGENNLAPTAPILNTVSSSCPTTTCQITLSWTSTDPTVVKYQVAYTLDGITTRTMDLTSTSAILALPANKTYVFTVYAYNASGAVSVASNSVIETPNYTAPVVKKVKKNPVVAAVMATPAQAASPIPTTNTTTPSPTSTTPSVDNSSETSSNDWLRISIIVIVLLAIAGGFYALSRSFADKDNKPVAKPKNTSAKKTKVVIAKRGRGRPKGTTKVPPKPKSTRGRGRPRKNT